MPLVVGQAISYSPLLYRPRERWTEVCELLIGDATPPAALAAENDAALDAGAALLDEAFWLAAERLALADLDALIVLVADHERVFDATNTPQLSVFIGDEIWGDPALAQLGEPPAPLAFRCAAALAAFVAEELAGSGFDISESRGAFAPADRRRGAGAALVEPLARLNAGVPIVPIHVNCHVEPAISAHRMAPFGRALQAALALVPGRFGLLVTGGLSGDPGGELAGWIDEVLDGWVLGRLRTGRAAQLGGIFDLASLTLRGATREVRLWTAAGAAMEAAGAAARLDNYLPLHHAAVGTAFMHWETSCR